MRRLIAVLCFLVLPAFAQEDAGADPALTELQAIATRLIAGPQARGIVQYQMPKVQIAISDEKAVNAFADLSTGMITIPRETIDVFGGDEGELAFIVAHEIGHVQDANCQARGIRQGLRGVALVRMCERAADMIAIQYMMAAGYSPFDAAGAFGRFMMLSNDRTSIFGILANRFLSDHPVDIDRIAALRTVAQQVCVDRPEVCAQFKPVGQ